MTIRLPCQTSCARPPLAVPHEGVIKHGALPWVAVGLLVASAARAEIPADWLGVDQFEYPPAQAFRISTLLLRDPHVFLQTPLGCRDFTDQPIPLTQISFNSQLAEALNGDANPADGLLDASSLLLFHPASQRDGALERLDQVAGACTAPATGTSCSNAAGTTAAPGNYLSSGLGACLEGLPGTTGAYTPALPSMSSPCFLTRAGDTTLDAQGATVPLRDGQLGARWGSGVLDQGLLRGFLTENAAAQILLPNPLPGQPPIPLSSLLRGGAGSCASGDDRDLHQSELGWWFYFEFSALPVPYSSP